MPVLVPGRRGMTIVELMVALVLMGIVSVGIYRTLTTNQRVYQAQTQRIDLQQNIRAGVTVLPADLRLLDATDGDIRAMGSTFVRFRAMRQLAFTCTVPVVGAAIASSVYTVSFVIRSDSLFFASRDFNTATDSILVYYEGDPGSRSDDSWLQGDIAAITPGVCADGAPGRLVTARLLYGTVATPAGVTPATVQQLPNAQTLDIGSPVWGFVIATDSLYQGSDGQWYVGFRQPGAEIQPLIGPVLSNGLQLSYIDATGAVTAIPAQVASIGITLRAKTAQPVRLNSGALIFPVDSVTTRVALRNNRRY